MQFLIEEALLEMLDAEERIQVEKERYDTEKQLAIAEAHRLVDAELGR